MYRRPEQLSNMSAMRKLSPLENVMHENVFITIAAVLGMVKNMINIILFIAGPSKKCPPYRTCVKR